MSQGHDEAMQKILFQMSVLYACSGAKMYYPSYAFILSPSLSKRTCKAITGDQVFDYNRFLMLCLATFEWIFMRKPNEHYT